MSTTEAQRSDATWLRDARFGVMLHYMPDSPSSTVAADMTPEKWNRIVDAANVDALAQTLAETGARYVLFTLGQNSGFFCSPNETYDELVGSAESRLSRRDLLADLAEACAVHDIAVLAYLPSHGPAKHREAVEALGFTPHWDASAWGLRPGMYLRRQDTDERLTCAQRNWESVIREWSTRWGERVKGWWFDGCYHAGRMYEHDDEPNWQSFAKAAKTGNPNSIVAFNTGVHYPIPTTPCDDYTAGEVNDLVVHHRHSPLARGNNQSQLHVLSFLGQYWCSGDSPRFDDALAVAYSRHVWQAGGAITWDVPVSLEGKIPDAFRKQLEAIGKARETF